MAKVLAQFSDELAGMVESAGQSLVRVEARRRMPATGIIWSADGVIVTAHHIVEREDKIHIGLPNGEKVPAKLVGRDPGTDIAVLRAEVSGLTAANWAGIDSVRVGHLILALGRPGDKVLATLGVVSALDEGWRTGSGGKIDAYLQTDVVMYPGFSGGALVDVSGKVLALNSSALSRGVTVSLPATTVKRVVETLLQHGKVKRGYLGIGTQAVRLPANSGAGQEIGLLVMSVEPDSPSEKGGLLLGDILLNVDGQSVQQVEELLSVLTGDRIGAAVPIKIVRGGAIQEVSVTVGERK